MNRRRRFVCLALIAAGVSTFLLWRYHQSSQLAEPVTSSGPAESIKRETPARSTPSDLTAFRQWVTGRWGSPSFAQGIDFVVKGDPQSRVLAMQKIFSRRDELTFGQLQELRRTLVRELELRNDDKAVLIGAIRTLGGVVDYLRSRDQISSEEIAADSARILGFIQDPSVDVQVRGASVRVMGDFRLESARPIIEQLLLDPANADTPEIARNGCLALVDISPLAAYPVVRAVFERTQEPLVFGTAAYCLGRINTPSAMTTLVLNERRFPDSGACDAALVEMEPVILDALKRPDSPEALAAILATEHLWKEGQRERYFAVLKELLVKGTPEVRLASSERLLDAAGRLPFELEKQELSGILPLISAVPELAASAEKIRGRLGATKLTPMP